MNFKSIWTNITNLGINESDIGREFVKIRLLNQVIFVGLIASSITLLSDAVFYTDKDKWLILTTFSNFLFEIVGVILIYNKKHQFARHLTCWVFPCFIATNVLILGGNFGEANIFTMLGFLGFIMYEGSRRVQIAIVTYISVLFISTKLYVLNYVERVNPNPYDELIIFPITLIVLGLIVYLYHRDLLKYEHQKSKLIKDLEHKNKALSQINNELEQFTYIASHDLKTPLRTISSHLDLIQWHIKRDDLKAVDIDIQYAKQGVTQMYALVNDILEYKDISQKSKSHEKVDLNELVITVTNCLKSEIDAKNGAVINQGLPTVMVRKKDFVVLFQNIISNGIKYNHSKEPKVTISYKTTSDSIIFFFKDNGIGIDPIYHDKIFHFFKRLHTINVYEGTGVGLGLCQKIASNYKGNIQVNSSEHNGSIFQVSLPKQLIITP